MTAHTFPSAITGHRLSWHELAAVARKHPVFAAAAIDQLREEAEQAASDKCSCSWRENRAIADACECYLDCPDPDGLDEIEALLNEDEPDFFENYERPGFDSPYWDYRRDLAEGGAA